MADHPTIENIFKPDAMSGILPALMAGGSGSGGMGAGLGAGLLGGVLGGVLLNRNGLLGGGVNGDVNVGAVTPAMLTSALAAQSENSNTTAVLQTLGDIKGAIPLAEGQMQLALAGAQADINGNINDVHSNVLTSQALVSKSIAESTATILAAESALKDAVYSSGTTNLVATKDASAANLAGQGGIRETVLTAGAATLSAIKDSAILAERNTWALTQAISSDGDKTRAILIAQNENNLQRQLTVAESALLDHRNSTRSRDVEVNVTQSVNQNQMQMQQQQQMQSLLSSVAVLAQQVNRSQQDIINVGGLMSGTSQTAANTNIR